MYWKHRSSILTFSCYTCKLWFKSLLVYLQGKNRCVCLCVCVCACSLSFDTLPAPYTLAFPIYRHYISKYVSTFLQHNFYSTSIGRRFLHYICYRFTVFSGLFCLLLTPPERIVCFYIVLTKPACDRSETHSEASKMTPLAGGLIVFSDRESSPSLWLSKHASQQGFVATRSCQAAPVDSAVYIHRHVNGIWHCRQQ